jgi:hypothetical protein
VRWLSWGSVLKRCFDLLNEIKLFREKKGRNIEELNDERWITDLAFLVDVTGHLNNLNKELQGKDKLITDVCNNIKAFRVKLRLWENQLNLHKLVHFPQLKSLDTVFPERIKEHSQSLFLFYFIFCFEKSSTSDSRTSKLWNQNFCCSCYP